MENINNISTGEIFSTIVSLNADYCLTCDDKLIRKATSLDMNMNIKIINPLRFIEDMGVN